MMDDLAGRLDAAADALGGAGRSLPDLAVPASAFGPADGASGAGGSGAGRAGRLAEALHAHWDAVLAARAREAADAAATLTGAAAAVRRTARAYDRVDDAAARRLRDL